MAVFSIICTIILVLFLFYAILPTLLIRTGGWGITKQLEGADGIALTFDDGPNPEYTIQLLDLLKKYQIKATFFVVGRNVKENTKIITRMYYEGHAIGIHHFDHVSSWFISPYKLKKQIQATQGVITECIKEIPLFYRPPWGHFNIFTLYLCKKYNVVMWSDLFGDWKVKNCKNGLLEQLREVQNNGSILLLHDCGETKGADKEAPKYMLETLEIYLRESKSHGRHFITLQEGLSQSKRSL